MPRNLKKEEFIATIKENRKIIYKICHSYCSNPNDRKDLEQEILLQLWTALPRFDGRVKLSTWIYKVALNTAISFFHKNRRHATKQIALDSTIIQLAAPEYDPTQDEQIAILHQFIEQLSPINKGLMLLYLDQKKHKEIAEILGISPSNVATKIDRIKKYFRKKFLKSKSEEYGN